VQLQPVELGVVGDAVSGVVCWSLETGRRSEWSRLLVRVTGGRSLLVLRSAGAASGVVGWSWDWWAQRAESSAGHRRLVGVATRVVCWSSDWRAQRAEPSAGLVRLVGATSGVVCWAWGIDGRSRLLVWRLVGAASGVACWSCDWRAWQAESSAGHWRLAGASSGVVCWSGGKWTQRAEASAGLATGGAAIRSCLLVVGLGAQRAESPSGREEHGRWRDRQ